MSKRQLMKGNEALCQATLDAGCSCFFGYPITPQNQVPERLSYLMPKAGRVFLQAESEVAAINMIYGAASTGVRAMTSSSSPGISLMQEGISYMTGADLPAVIINVMRGGPGLGNIAPSQSDYFQATRGGGHGDYRLLVLAPSSVQEMYDLTRDAFELADKYRNPVMVLADAILGQMMEAVTITREPQPVPELKPWGAHGTKKGSRTVINSLYINPPDLEAVNKRLQAKYDQMRDEDLRWKESDIDGADIVFIAYGSSARICTTAINLLAEKGIKAGLFRPITLFPFPYERLSEISKTAKKLLTVEMSLGQMIEDVRLATQDRCPLSFYGRTGGIIPTPEEVAAAALKELGK
ncbi:MAG TPA: 3-methyl-2-oxobutanoate dehydrogenase subunit VorB [Armatimonadota bacterium]|nr:3-methyl-2-oxobutanoate dehydrogenase subunit VorB [Armatimonadota bacterium]